MAERPDSSAIIRFMRKLLLFCIVGLPFILFIGGVSAPFLIEAAIEKNLARQFSGSQVQIGDSGFEWLPDYSISHIHVKHKLYEASLKKVTLDRRLRLTVEEPALTLNAIPKGFATKSGGKKSAFAPRVVEISKLRVDIRLPRFRMKGSGSLEFNLKQNSFAYVNLELTQIEKGLLKLDKVEIESWGGNKGTVKINEVQYGKLKLSAIHAVFHEKNGVYQFEPLDANLIGGRLSGSANVEAKNLNYTATLVLTDLKLVSFVEEMEYQKKIRANGGLIGKINLNGDATGLHFLNGELFSSGGGDIVIEESAWLERLAKNTKQPLSIIEAGFKEYHYDKGNLNLSLEENDLNLGFDLNGPKGRRNLSVKLHDVF
jgi:hypothetical protein